MTLKIDGKTKHQHLSTLAFLGLQNDECRQELLFPNHIKITKEGEKIVLIIEGKTTPIFSVPP